MLTELTVISVRLHGRSVVVSTMSVAMLCFYHLLSLVCLQVCQYHYVLSLVCLHLFQNSIWYKSLLCPHLTVPALASSWRQETGEPASRQPGPCGTGACIEQATPFPGHVNQCGLFFNCVFLSVLVFLRQIWFVRLFCQVIGYQKRVQMMPMSRSQLVATKTSCFRTR